MNVVILLICCGIALLTFLISLIGYPLIASMFDMSPGVLAFLSGMALFFLTLFITVFLVKKEFIRRCIIIPCFFSCLLSATISIRRFRSYSDDLYGGYHYETHYHNGYINTGKLYNHWGFCIISQYNDWYKIGIDEYGNDIIMGYNTDDIDSDDDETLYEISINFYDINGHFKDRAEYRHWFSDPRDIDPFLDDRVKAHYNITVFDRIGYKI